MSVAFNGPYGYRAGGSEYDSETWFTVYDPGTEDSLAQVAESDEAGVNEAITAAEEALAEWADTDPGDRGQLLQAVATRVREEAERLARIETLECGRPLGESMGLLAAAAEFFEYYAGMPDKIEGDTIPVPGKRHNYTVREPLGVIGIVLPWNGPTLLGARSIPAALACGNTLVVKPAPEAPIAIMELGRILDDVLPEGVFNVVPGDGPTTGAALTGDPRLDRVMFTGSRDTGSIVMQSAAENIVPVGLELGGKNPNVIFPDAPLEKAIEDSMKAFYNAGQVCFAPTRVFIHESIYDRVLDRLIDRAEKMTIDVGMNTPDLGPLITAAARDRVVDYVDEAIENGGRLRTGGEIPRETGHFYEPTIVDQVSDDEPISCEEVFGPVLTAYSFATEAEVIGRANDVEYGLNAVVWTRDLARAHRVAGELEAGTVTVNEYPGTFAQAPSGPYKQSGIGREKGQQAIEDYTNLKNVNVSLTDTPDNRFEE